MGETEQEVLQLEVDEQKSESPDTTEEPEGTTAETLSVEDLVESLETVIAERDDFRDSLQRLQADFENFRRRSANEVDQRISQGISRLAEALLPVLDACDAASEQGLEEVAPIRNALEAVLANNGLTRIEALGVQFDPQLHDAMSFETGESDDQIVVEELRAGYRWGESIPPSLDGQGERWLALSCRREVNDGSAARVV